MNELSIRIGEVREQIGQAEEQGQDSSELKALLKELEDQKRIIDML